MDDQTSLRSQDERIGPLMQRSNCQVARFENADAHLRICKMLNQARCVMEGVATPLALFVIRGQRTRM
jgi:hypothetical protein